MDWYVCVCNALSALGGSAVVPKEKIYYVEQPLPSNLKLYSYAMFVLWKKKAALQDVLVLYLYNSTNYLK